MTQLAEGAALVTPLFVGLAAHGVCIRSGTLSNLARPISGRLFGANKTYRGIVCVAVGTAIGFVLIRPGLLKGFEVQHAALLGLAVGAAAMAAELPNSFAKRRLGIAPGTQAHGVRGVLFHVLDQVDLVLGAWIVLAWVTMPTWARLAGSLVTVYAGHQVLSLAGYGLGMRSTAR